MFNFFKVNGTKINGISKFELILIEKNVLQTPMVLKG